MRQNWTFRLLAKVHQEVRVKLETSFLTVYVQLHHHRSCPEISIRYQASNIFIIKIMLAKFIVQEFKKPKEKVKIK